MYILIKAFGIKGIMEMLESQKLRKAWLSHKSYIYKNFKNLNEHSWNL
ncbi:MAG: hypothetical protein K0Q97_1224 [Bacillota bacterium]|jgi:hypothetical protein|nr:hypothetical protein [Bacillota bacterium]